MLGKDLETLINLVHQKNKKDVTVIKKELADKLNINVKTINNWITVHHDSESRIGRPYVAYLRKIFEPLLIRDVLRVVADKAFAIAPSELVCFWLVCGTEVVLIKDSVRNELLQPPRIFRYYNDEIHKTLNDISLTIESIQTTQVINTSGKGKKELAYLETPHIVTTYLLNNHCYSNLKIPLIKGSNIGPRVLGLLELVNKLERKADKGFEPMVHTAYSENDNFYTSDEINALRSMALNEFADHLKGIMRALDYFEPDTSLINISC